LTSIVQTIIHKHRALHKLFDHHWAHLIMLDVYSDCCLRYEARGHGESVLEPVNVT